MSHWARSYLILNPPRGRLNNEGFVEMMRRVKISLLAVDESHCISQVSLAIVLLSLD